ncbi:MAG TPA: ATP-binding cassette domain-containing protein, partial [Ignisphaera sp.]|nr:ATP-binding cassette domain-containing protein [Ignisphaera sp.]
MIEFKDVYKIYSKNVVALQGASFTIPSGTLACLLGPNGAGKTTTMKLIAGFLRPSSGTVKVWGLEPWIHEKEVRERIGFLHERPIYPHSVTVYQL